MTPLITWSQMLLLVMFNQTVLSYLLNTKYALLSTSQLKVKLDQSVKVPTEKCYHSTNLVDIRVLTAAPFTF